MHTPTEMKTIGTGIRRKILNYNNNIMLCELHFEKMP